MSPVAQDNPAHRSRGGGGALLLLLALVAACAPPRPNVLLVTLDTTRADHLGCYGYRRATSPHIDRLAADSQRYTRAYATSSWTLPSHASLFTGKLTTSHGARQDPHGPLRLTQAIDGPASWDDYRVRSLARGETTLASILADSGYATGAVVAGPWMKRVFGLAQGFESYDDREISEVNGRTATQVSDAALAFLDRLDDRPFFLFLNYYDPHYPYDPPAAYARPFLEELAGTGNEAAALPRKRALYDAEIRSMDEQLGRLLETLRRRDLWESTLVVVTADHGHLFGEHGLTGHGYYLYEAELRIPLLVKPPGRTQPAIVDQRLQLTDVMPLILGHLALPLPPQIQGRPPGASARPIVAEVYPRPASDRYAGDWRAWIDGSFKLLWNSREEHELYDLTADPGEQVNLAASHPEKLAAMQASLESYLGSLPPPLEPGPDQEIDPETQRALQGLGYLE